MITVLAREKLSPTEQAGLLARGALAVAAERMGGRALDPFLPGEEELRTRIIQEIRAQLEITPDDRSDNAFRMIEDALDAEMEAVAEPVDLEAALDRAAALVNLPAQTGEVNAPWANVPLPHPQRPLSMHGRMAELEFERDAAFRALDQLPWGIVFVDEHHNLLLANRHAEEILMAGDGLTARDNTVRAQLPDETARLDRLLSTALAPAGPPGSSAGGTLSITRLSGAPPLRAVVVPLDIRTKALGERHPIAAIFITDPDIPLDGSNQQYLRGRYALTAAEARLASWLVQGKSVEEAAAAMRISVNTARVYLKRIYHKTGVRRQPELMRLLLLDLPRLRGGTATRSRSRHLMRVRNDP